MKKLLFLLLITTIANAKNIVIVGLWPLAPIVSLLSDANLTLIPKASYNAMQHSLIKKYRPGYQKSILANNPNLEELILLNADLYICGISNIKICQGLKAANLNVIELTTNINSYNSKLTLAHWLKELEKHFDISKKSRSIIEYISNIENQIKTATTNAKKPKALIIHRIDKDNITSGIFNDYLITASGALNQWGKKQKTSISIEEIFAYDPDIIYISNFTQTIPDDIYSKKQWQSINAVKNKRVYKLPMASYRPFAPSLDLGLTLLFLTKHNHPDIFMNLNLKDEYEKFYKIFFDISLDNQDIHMIFNPSIEAAITN